MRPVRARRETYRRVARPVVQAMAQALSRSARAQVGALAQVGAQAQVGVSQWASSELASALSMRLVERQVGEPQQRAVAEQVGCAWSPR